MDQAEHYPGPSRLSKTDNIIGDFETPLELEGNRADMALLREARKVLGYQSFILLHYWWVRFPSAKWWRYAIAATKYLARYRNYSYFLRCLLSAAQQDRHYLKFVDYLEQISAQEFRDAMSRQAERDEPPCESCTGRGCEECDPAILQVRQVVAKKLTRPIDCFDCSGRVCARCVRMYLQVMSSFPAGETASPARKETA